VNGYVIRGKDGTKFLSTEKETYGQETIHDTLWQADYVKKQFETDFPNIEFYIEEVTA
jgi:hypothetical protein